MLKFRFQFILWLILTGGTAYSQSLLRSGFTSAGGMYNGLPAIESNIGEVVSSYYNNGSNLLTQGFIQNELLSVNLNALNSISSGAIAFPNPVSTVLNLRLFVGDAPDALIEVLDVLGKKQLVPINASESGTVFEINFVELRPGVYFVKVNSDKNNFQQIIKVTKVLQ